MYTINILWFIKVIETFYEIIKTNLYCSFIHSMKTQFQNTSVYKLLNYHFIDMDDG